MGRKHRRTPGGDRRDDEDLVPDADGWIWRRITGSSSTRTYRCPGCDHEIRPATPHVVAWHADGSVDDRRHWHTACWEHRDRRGPTRR